MPENHPDFDAAKPGHRWTKGLKDLAAELRHRAYQLKGETAWYILPHGALVSMRVDPKTFTKELRLARKGTPNTDRSWAAWTRECEVFLEYLGAKTWVLQMTRSIPDIAEGGVESIYREILTADKQHDKCHRCGADCEKGPYKEATCNRCAMELGAQEAEALRNRRTAETAEKAGGYTSAQDQNREARDRTRRKTRRRKS